MALYRYKAINDQGKTVQGALEARDENDLVHSFAWSEAGSYIVQAFKNTVIFLWQAESNNPGSDYLLLSPRATGSCRHIVD